MIKMMLRKYGTKIKKRPYIPNVFLRLEDARARSVTDFGSFGYKRLFYSGLDSAEGIFKFGYHPALYDTLRNVLAEGIAAQAGNQDRKSVV